MAELGVYVGNSKTALTNFETWLGRPADGVLGYVGQQSWSDFVNSAAWAASGQMWEGSNREVYWSVPLIVNGANLTAAARGDYNAYYRQVAQSLLGYDHNESDIYIRTGWEFNGGWMPWAAAGQTTQFIGAFRQFVDTFRSVSDRFKFEWTPNVGTQQVNPETAYPGDAYVDVIGMDFYWDPYWWGTDPVRAFQTARDQAHGLQWLESFAAAHNKPTAYSEWGVHESVNGTEYVKLVDQWFESHNVLYQTYWDSNASFPGKISDGSDPDTGSAYIAAFQQPDAPAEEPPYTGPLATYWLIDTTTNQKLVQIEDGVAFDRSVIQGKKVSLAAFEGNHLIESVRLNLDDDYVKVENVEPYALFGDNMKGDYYSGVALDTGIHHATFELYAADNASGVLLGREQIEFFVAKKMIVTDDALF